MKRAIVQRLKKSEDRALCGFMYLLAPAIREPSICIDQCGQAPVSLPCLDANVLLPSTLFYSTFLIRSTLRAWSERWRVTRRVYKTSPSRSLLLQHLHHRLHLLNFVAQLLVLFPQSLVGLPRSSPLRRLALSAKHGRAPSVFELFLVVINFTLEEKDLLSLGAVLHHQPPERSARRASGLTQRSPPIPSVFSRTRPLGVPSSCTRYQKQPGILCCCSASVHPTPWNVVRNRDRMRQVIRTYHSRCSLIS